MPKEVAISFIIVSVIVQQPSWGRR